MELFSDRLHLVEGCGRNNRTIYLIDINTVQIGCFRGTKDEAVAEIRRRYEGQEAEDYIQKVYECFEGTSDPDKIRYYATHHEWIMRWEVATQGIELELLRKDPQWMVRMQAGRAKRKIEKLRFQKAAFLIDRGYDADEDYQKMLDT